MYIASSPLIKDNWIIKMKNALITIKKKHFPISRGYCCQYQLQEHYYPLLDREQPASVYTVLNAFEMPRTMYMYKTLPSPCQKKKNKKKNKRPQPTKS